MLGKITFGSEQVCVTNFESTNKSNTFQSLLLYGIGQILNVF